MIKTLQKIMKQDKERFIVPKGVQQAISIRAIWPDGIFRVGNKFSKSYRCIGNEKNIEEARNYFSRIGTDLITHFSHLGSKCVELDATDRLRILHDFFRAGEETDFHFDLPDTMRKGHDFKDYICPDTFEFEKDHFRMGNIFGRVIFLREYASYIKDSMVSELCDLNRNMMLSLDIPIPTDEAVREVENRLLGVETNITNWQRRQNQSNNFSAVVPYDMEQQRKESKEFLDDLTTRDQRMMFAVLTMVHIADSNDNIRSNTCGRKA